MITDHQKGKSVVSVLIGGVRLLFATVMASPARAGKHHRLAEILAAAQQLRVGDMPQHADEAVVLLVLLVMAPGCSFVHYPVAMTIFALTNKAWAVSSGA